MSVNILAVGDICGPVGLEFFSKKLRTIKKHYNIAFTVVNGENASGLGVIPSQIEEMLDAGADVVTLGNHVWSRREICNFLDDSRYTLRPANLAPQAPGRGWGVFDSSFGEVCVINLIGRVGVPMESDNPFHEVDKILKQVEAKIILVDFHAEMTSEKYAMAYHLDGRVSVVWGTHTHVQTSDNRVFAGKTGYITDIGMTGAVNSIIGMEPKEPVEHFLGNPTDRYKPATGPAKLEGAIFEIDDITGECLSVETIRIL
ncbi:MAG: YmdB family metallophosphoesterase [Oscillospiraceae bacterium]|nr:YmdB family metallophosphoesterase [Oscillospiraceae bacterium]